MIIICSNIIHFSFPTDPPTPAEVAARMESKLAERAAEGRGGEEGGGGTLKAQLGPLSTPQVQETSKSLHLEKSKTLKKNPKTLERSQPNKKNLSLIKKL
jgi:hypothetical protein